MRSYELFEDDVASALEIGAIVCFTDDPLYFEDGEAVVTVRVLNSSMLPKGCLQRIDIKCLREVVE